MHRQSGPLRNVPIAQDSSVNDQTRFMMCNRSYGVRGCVRSGSHRMLLLLHVSPCGQLEACRTRLHACENLYLKKIVQYPAGTKCCIAPMRPLTGALTVPRQGCSLADYILCSAPYLCQQVQLGYKSNLHIESMSPAMSLIEE